ncbi:pyocin knob domain-containing protein [Citrobacter werkmanii]|uniref:pyocin knob domain-containing protein n=1 Tax=Citrobacter werkmanii TaxID=67827 RepID=UPI002F32100D
MSETVNKVAILSSAVKHALLADVQYYDFHASSAFNRKMKGIITPGFYGGFEPALAGGLNLKITSLQGPGGHGVASVDVNNHQITVQQIEDVTLAIPVNGVTRVMLEANYQYGVKTSQVDDSSDIHAARIFTANISVPLADNHLEICRVTVPADATELTLDMIDSSHRRNKALGITLSSEIDSDADHIAASSHAVKKAVKAARDETEKQIEELVDGAPASLDTLKKIADAINNDPDFFNTLTAILKLKAPLESPALTGIPTVPTPPLSVSNKQVANTEYVQAAVAALVGSSPEALDTLAELASALGNDPNFATTMLNKLAGKQPLDATLTALASLATGANKLPYFTGNDSVAQTDLTQVGRDILAKASIAAVIQYLGLVETINLAAGAVPSTRKINGHALSGDTNVTAQDIFNGQVIAIGANQNLDNYQTPGLYAQDMNVNTSAALNYPENNAGSLMVLRGAGVTQVYHTYNSSRIWSRSKYSTGAWTPWAREYNTQNKPGATDVGALPITGGTITGPLGIGVANGNGLGGNSIVLGDSDTGFKQEGDGILNVYANSALVMRFISSLIESLKPLKVNGNCIATGELQAGNGAVRLAADGNVYGTMWGGWLRDYLAANFQSKGNFTPAGQAYTKAESDARYVQNIRVSAPQERKFWDGAGWSSNDSAFATAIWMVGGSSNVGGLYVRYLQKNINGTWINVTA